MYKKMYFRILLLLIFSFMAAGECFAVTKTSKTDIKAYMDYTPIKSYNIDSSTYIIAEELEDYGFDVSWDGIARTLKLTRKKLATPIYTKEYHDSVYSDSEFMIYDTDIKTYLNSREIKSYNIGGRTIVLIDEFADCGDVLWDGQAREISLLIYESEIEGLFESAEEKVVISEENLTYEGEVNLEGKPSGVAKLKTKEYFGNGGVGYVKTEEITGCFENGIPIGNVVLKRNISAGKIGVDIETKFIGEILPEYETDFNFGNLTLPYYKCIDYMGNEIFSDNFKYGCGVWFEQNKFRGQEDIYFKSWHDGEVQSVLKTEQDGTKINIYFEEF